MCPLPLNDELMFKSTAYPTTNPNNQKHKPESKQTANQHKIHYTSI